MSNGRARRKKLLRRLQNNRCFYCGEEMDISATNPLGWSTFDEVIPRYRGGQTTRDNQVLACMACNRKKGHREPTPEEIDRLAALMARMPPLHPHALEKIQDILDEIDDMEE